MLSDSFKLYYADTIGLVRSFVYKIELQNDLINTRLQEMGYVVDNDPTTWKYNLNLAGLYHPIDTPMTVISFDTKEEISYDKETLKFHPRTALRYIRGTREYRDLVSRYPTQEVLINGISNPIDLSRVVNANNFEIISFRTGYIADNERSLMRRVQEWMDGFITRWWHPQRAINNPLYPANFVQNLNMYLVCAVMTIRQELAHTDEVCQFHLWNYLGWHYNLDRYKLVLSLSQSLWLYRNIRHIRKNAGKQYILEDMIDALLTPAGLDLDKLDFLQLDDNLLVDFSRSGTYSLTNYYASTVSLASGDRLNPESAHELLLNAAPFNEADSAPDLAFLKRKGEGLKENWLPTKVLKANETGALVTQSISNLPIKMNYWVYLSYLDLFTGSYPISSGSLTTLYLTPKEAFILYMYAANASYGRFLSTIPEITVKSVRAVNIPSAEEVYPLVDQTRIEMDEVQTLLNYHFDLVEISTRDEFVDFIDRVVTTETIQDMVEETYQHPELRSMMRDVSDALITDLTFRLVPEGTPYSEWLYDIGIDKDGLDRTEWYDLAGAIASEIIDYSGDTTSVGRKQRAMIEILDMLTSYDVKIIEGIGTVRSRTMNWPSALIYDFEIGLDIVDYIDSGEKALCGIDAIGLSITKDVESDNNLDSDIAMIMSEIDIDISLETEYSVESTSFIDFGTEHVYNEDN